MLKKKTSFLHYKKQASRYKNDILQKKGCRFFVQQYNNTSNTYVINVNVNKILPMDKNSTQLMEKKNLYFVENNKYNLKNQPLNF